MIDLLSFQDKSGGLFSGEFCELFPNEINPCNILHDCVECQAFGTGIYAEGKPAKSMLLKRIFLLFL